MGGDGAGKEHGAAQRENRNDLRNLHLFDDFVTARHDGDHAVIAVEQIGKQVHVFDFDCFEFIFLLIAYKYIMSQR